MLSSKVIVSILVAFAPTCIGVGSTFAQTNKPVLHGKHWVAITGKPLGATAGATIFARGGNAVDATCAMLAVVCTMYDVLSWGGETQALIYNPNTKKVYGINALGVAPTGATPEFFKEKKMPFPPRYGPLAAVTPGTPGGLLTMLAEFGSISLKEVLQPAMQMADGYPIEEATADRIEKEKEWIKKWPYSKKVLLPHLGEDREAPYAGEIFRQSDLLNTLKKLVEAEQKALAAGQSRKEAHDELSWLVVNRTWYPTTSEKSPPERTAIDSALRYGSQLNGSSAGVSASVTTSGVARLEMTAVWRNGNGIRRSAVMSTAVEDTRRNKRSNPPHTA